MREENKGPSTGLYIHPALTATPVSREGGMGRVGWDRKG